MRKTASAQAGPFTRWSIGKPDSLSFAQGALRCALRRRSSAGAGAVGSWRERRRASCGVAFHRPWICATGAGRDRDGGGHVIALALRRRLADERIPSVALRRQRCLWAGSASHLWRLHDSLRGHGHPHRLSQRIVAGHAQRGFGQRGAGSGLRDARPAQSLRSAGVLSLAAPGSARGTVALGAAARLPRNPAAVAGNLRAAGGAGQARWRSDHLLAL